MVHSLAYIYSLCFYQKDMCEVKAIDQKTLLYTLSSYSESSFLQRLKHLWLEVCVFYSATLNLSYNIYKKCVLEILFQFYISIWISSIHTFKFWIFLRKKIQYNLCYKEITSQKYYFNSTYQFGYHWTSLTKKLNSIHFIQKLCL